MVPQQLALEVGGVSLDVLGLSEHEAGGGHTRLAKLRAAAQANVSSSRRPRLSPTDMKFPPPLRQSAALKTLH